jgi:hypothetical protein
MSRPLDALLNSDAMRVMGVHTGWLASPDPNDSATLTVDSGATKA